MLMNFGGDHKKMFYIINLSTRNIRIGHWVLLARKILALSRLAPSEIDAFKEYEKTTGEIKLVDTSYTEALLFLKSTPVKGPNMAAKAILRAINPNYKEVVEKEETIVEDTVEKDMAADEASGKVNTVVEETSIPEESTGEAIPTVDKKQRGRRSAKEA